MKIQIKYNPISYTEIKVNGKNVKSSSKLNVGKIQLNEWIYNLPAIIKNEYDIKEFEIVFIGTQEDYSVIDSAVKQFAKEGFDIKLTHILSDYNEFPVEKFNPMYMETKKSMEPSMNIPKRNVVNILTTDEKINFEEKFYNDTPSSRNYKRIFIKYNPYIPLTRITVEGEKTKKNSNLNVGELRLQEWIEKLPKILYDEYNCNCFKIGFYGTTLDCDDLKETSIEAEKDGIDIEIFHYPAKDVKYKEMGIKAIFDDIQKGPFNELKDKNIVNAFNNAFNSNFEVDVIATMSAGKSTLINSLLCKKLMPSKQEACTAIITKIKDNNNKTFAAEIYDKEGNKIKDYSDLTYEIMQKVNLNNDVYDVFVEGDIPFVTSDDMSLILVDTPGPNNARNKNHERTTFDMLSESEKTLILYIMNAGQLKTTDDNAVLDFVAKNMKVGGKQSRDRFLFVVNKLDDFKKGEDDVKSSLNGIREYLKEKGIENPNIYPASALTALNIRTILAESDDDDDDEVYEAKGKVRKFNKNEEMHFENLAPLAPSVKNRINDILQEAEKNGDKNKQALVHCGIIPLEEAIKMYVRKYARPMKIRNIVDTFKRKLESCNSFEKVKNEITKNKEKYSKILDSISKIENKIKSGEEAKKFRNKIENINFVRDMNSEVDKIISNAHKDIRDTIASFSGKKISTDTAELVQKNFVSLAKNIQNKLVYDLENLVDKYVKRNSEELLNQYREKLSDLTNDITIDSSFQMNPLSIMTGNISSIDMTSMIKEDKVLKGERKVIRRKPFWERLFDWDWKFTETVYDYDSIKYIDMTDLSHRFFAQLNSSIDENSNSAIEYAKKQIEKIKGYFLEKFDELDRILQIKLNELKKCMSDEKEAENMIKESEERLEWLKQIQDRVNLIIEI